MKIHTFCSAAALSAVVLAAGAQHIVSPTMRQSQAPQAAAASLQGAQFEATLSQDSLRVSLEKRNKARVLEAYRTVFAEGRADLADKYFARDLIQHDPAMTAGLQGVVEQVKRDSAASARPITTIKHTIADGHYVLVHSHVSATPINLFSGVARMDLYRLSGGMIVEHWAVAQAVATTTVSGNSIFNDAYQYVSPPAPATQAQEDASKQMVVKAMTMLFVGHNTDVLSQYWAGDAYLQHNARIPNGLSGVRAMIAGFGPVSFQPRFVVAEGDLVFTLSQAVFGQSGSPIRLNSDYTGAAIADLFRVVDGVIVEHWDALFPVPATSMSGNSMFSEMYVSPF